MKKSDFNFDLRGFLVENKLTESGRDTRYHFKKTFLTEMRMPAEEDIMDDEFEAEPDQELGLTDDKPLTEINGDDVERGFETWYPDHETEFHDENEAYEYYEQNVYGQESVDECDPDMGAGNPLEEFKAGEKDSLYRELVGYQTKYGQDRGMKIFKHYHSDLSDDELGKIIPDFARQNNKVGMEQDQERLNKVSTFDQHDRSEDRPTYDKYGYRTGNMLLDPVHKSMSEALDELGYGDDEEDSFQGDDLDLTAGDSFANSIGNKKSKKAFDKSNDTDFDAPDDEPFDSDFVDPEDIDGDDEEPEVPAAKTGKDGSDVTSLVSKFHQDAGKEYDPEAVDLEFGDDEEFADYLQGFSRPPVALKCLERAIRQAQKEVNDGISKRIYLVFKDGFYETQAFRRGNVVATIYRSEEFGSED